MSQQTSIPQPPKKQLSKGLIIGIVIIAIVLISIFAFIFFTFINRPKPEIIFLNGYETFQGLNYVYEVDVSVRNNGPDGWVRVYAQINGAEKYDYQDKRIYLANGEINSSQFVFDISLWGALSNPSITYTAWAKAD